MKSLKYQTKDVTATLQGKIWKSSSTNKARRVENQQTQPTYDEEDRIETRPVLLPLPLQGKNV